MSELLINVPTTVDLCNAYFDGARAVMRLYAVWKDGQQFVGMGRPLDQALDDLEEMRQQSLQACTDFVYTCPQCEDTFSDEAVTYAKNENVFPYCSKICARKAANNENQT